ncbi:MAG: hypothetical protein ACD_55C00012G0001, partial [uncultured bacterium]
MGYPVQPYSREMVIQGRGFAFACRKEA